MVGDQLKPPPWRRAWPPILAGVAWSVMVAVGVAWLMHDPPPPPPEEPFTSVETRAFFVEREGHGQVWRTEIVARVDHTCGAVVVDRRFAPIGGEIRLHDPLFSYLDEMGWRLGTAPYSIELTEGDVLTAWHEYKIVPGEHGHLLIEAEAFACQNGFAGAVPIDAIPYDWRTPAVR
jgi:hypothetical protein